MQKMKIIVKVKPGAKQEIVEKRGDREFILWVKAQAKENKANVAVRELLSKYFDVSKSAVTIIHGHKSKNKIISVDNALFCRSRFTQ